MLTVLRISAGTLFLAGAALLRQTELRWFLAGVVLAFVTAPMFLLASILLRKIMSGAEIFRVIDLKAVLRRIDAEYRR